MTIRVFDLKMQVDHSEAGISSISMTLYLDGKVVLEQAKTIKYILRLAEMEIELKDILEMRKVE